MIKNVHWSLYKAPLFFSDFKETWSFSIDFREKYLNIKFYKNPCRRSRVVPCGRTDRHDKANSRVFAILRNRLEIKPLLIKQ